MRAAPATGGPPADLWRKRRLGATLGRQVQRLVPLGLYRRLVPRPVVGLCYHVVSARPLPHVESLYRYKTPEQFESDLEFLARNFRVLSADEVERERESPKPGRPAAVITFDDGFAECHSVARPLLLKHGLPCTFFVVPGVLDNRRMFTFDRASVCLGVLEGMEPEARRSALAEVGERAGRRFDDLEAFADWVTRWVRSMGEEDEATLDGVCGALGVDPGEYLRTRRPYLTTAEVRELAADGFTIGAHALRHVALGTLERPEEVARQVVGSCRAVAELVGTERVPFAFPFDADGVDRSLLEGLRERHPVVGLLYDTRRLRPDREFMVNRMIVDAPPALGRSGSNLPTYLRGAYWDELFRPGAARGAA